MPRLRVGILDTLPRFECSATPPTLKLSSNLGSKWWETRLFDLGCTRNSQFDILILSSIEMEAVWVGEDYRGPLGLPQTAAFTGNGSVPGKPDWKVPMGS